MSKVARIIVANESTELTAYVLSDGTVALNAYDIEGDELTTYASVTEFLEVENMHLIKWEGA